MFFVIIKLDGYTEAFVALAPVPSAVIVIVLPTDVATVRIPSRVAEKVVLH